MQGKEKYKEAKYRNVSGVSDDLFPSCRRRKTSESNESRVNINASIQARVHVCVWLDVL